MSDIDRRDSPRNFATTRWSVVLVAGQTSSPDADAALATLCETYWFPLYAYVRRRGHDVNSVVARPVTGQHNPGGNTYCASPQNGQRSALA